MEDQLIFGGVWGRRGGYPAGSSIFPCLYFQSSHLALSHSWAPGATSLAPSPALASPLQHSTGTWLGRASTQGKLPSSSPSAVGTFQPLRTQGCCRNNPDPAGCRGSLWSKTITCFHGGPEGGREGISWCPAWLSKLLFTGGDFPSIISPLSSCPPSFWDSQQLLHRWNRLNHQTLRDTQGRDVLPFWRG